MADALISPAVGGVLWTAGTAAVFYAAKKTGEDFPEKKIPLMGVLGAFIFAAQMINFAIPGTGSSGHLGGGLLLAVLIGPHAGFLTMTSILMIQALLFADGGLLALGCNVFNMAFIPCYIAYPLFYKTIVGNSSSRVRVAVGVTVATILGLQLGALGVVAETIASGISELPYQMFALFMMPIHLAIGAVEAAVTTAVLWYLWREEPALFAAGSQTKSSSIFSVRRIAVVLLIGAVLTAGMLSWFASDAPDGLEWSVLKTAGKEDVENSSQWHAVAASWQEKTALFADYQVAIFGSSSKKDGKQEEEKAWPAVDKGTSVAGVLGSVLTLAAVGAVGFGCHYLAKRSAN